MTISLTQLQSWVRKKNLLTMEKKIALIVLTIWLGVVACKLSCTNVRGVHKVQNVQMAQSMAKADKS